MSDHDISQRRACRLVSVDPKTVRREAEPDNPEIRTRMREIAARYASGDQSPRMIALGDAPNDIEMLETADIGVIVANPHANPLPELDGEKAGRIARTQKPGPEGWNESVLRIIEDRQDS